MCVTQHVKLKFAYDDIFSPLLNLIVELSVLFYILLFECRISKVQALKSKQLD